MKSYEKTQQILNIPIQCRNGPYTERRCTDLFCCLMYLVLIVGSIALAILTSSAPSMSTADINKSLTANDQAQPLLSIVESQLTIILSLLCTTAICFFILVLTFLIPALVTYIFIPLSMLLMVTIGAGFLYRYFGNKLPLISDDIQANYPPQTLSSLVLGIGFILGFLVSILVICIKESRFKSITTILRVAKICFWDNFYILFVAFGLTIISILALLVNLTLLKIGQHTTDDTVVVPRLIYSVIIIVEMLWTHGYLQSYSDFIFESIAVHWYYNEVPNIEKGYSAIGKNLCPSISLSFKHIGTIVFSHILAYIPQSLNLLLNPLQNNCTTCYNCFCMFHKCALNYLSKYSHIKTIMQSKSFCEATSQMHEVRIAAKSQFSHIYMLGHFYNTISRIFIVLLTFLVAYLLLLAENPTYYSSIPNLIAPLIIVLLGSLQISTHFTNTSGTIADTIYFCYIYDLTCQKNNFGNTQPSHCPPAVHAIFKEEKLGVHFEDQEK